MRYKAKKFVEFEQSCENKEKSECKFEETRTEGEDEDEGNKTYFLTRKR